MTLPRLLPVNHYVRKNAGYIPRGKAALPAFMKPMMTTPPPRTGSRAEAAVRALPAGQDGWCNVYAHFSGRHILAARLSPGKIAASRRWRPSGSSARKAPSARIQQGLADGNPDVDAIWRLLLPGDVRFKSRRSVALMRGAWCPFNSQSTWWWPEAYPLMYLPSHCTFRMTDIWRSFIAQRCVWELGGAVTFHAPEVVQERNVHNLLRDFQDEVPGYLNNTRLCGILAGLRLTPGPKAVPENLLCCYAALVQHNIFPKKELPLVKAWLRDLKDITRGVTF